MRPFIFLVFAFSLALNLHAQTVLRGVVKDATSGAAIAGAKISISQQGPGVITNSTGRFVYKKYEQILDKESTLTIQAKGYKSLTLSSDQIRDMFNLQATFKLTPGTEKGSNVGNVVGVLWDVSKDMKGRNTQQELDFLSSKLSDMGNAEVQFYVFNDKLLYQNKTQIKGGDISSFRESLKGITTGGMSNYNILDLQNMKEVYLFSNAQPTLGFLDIDPSTVVNVITSQGKTSGMIEIASLIKFSGGDYYDLTKGTAPINLEKVSSTQVVNKITGKITSSGRPLQAATLSIKGNFDEYLSDSNGAYSIPAEEGDIIQVRYLGMYPKSAVVEASNILDFELIPENEELDEVVLSGKKKADDNTITTGYGKENKDKLGYAVDEITSDEFNEGATSLRDLITGRFSSVTVSFNAYEGESYRIRGGSGSINDDVGPLWVVDGTPYEVVPAFLDVQQIASISILKSLSSTNRYGTLARGGAFVITTKAASVGYQEQQKQKVNSALVKGNDYTESTMAGVVNEENAYMAQIRKQPTVSKQYAYFNQITQGRDVSLELYTDAVTYFLKKDKAIADKIFSDFAYVARNSPKALRTLAYLYEEAGYAQEAYLTYKRILKIAPQEAQSYRDVANALTNIGEYNKALELYINMLGEQIKGIDFTGIEPVLKTELVHLAKRHKDKIEFDRLPNEWLVTNFKQDMRMVIEWSDRTVPFEFQFVNPKNKFFKWNHTLEENRDRLLDEKKQGFQIEEFIIDDARRGEWIVNVQYLGQQDDYKLPPFLKYTVYSNYGTDKETKEVKVIKLFRQTEKVRLATLEI